MTSPMKWNVQKIDDCVELFEILASRNKDFANFVYPNLFGKDLKEKVNEKNSESDICQPNFTEDFDSTSQNNTIKSEYDISLKYQGDTTDICIKTEASFLKD